ncbi:RcpC/CpaB family pilus assembly protein [Streptomyces sp. NPDC049813]|uniref:RcpC/CpaB family pilus assembly protein n=1 Tax=Streptomyces sp. NPDC049813 TaxID=3365597 RepID=UPI00379D9BEA
MSVTTPPAQLSTPPTSEVPSFPPVRVRGARGRTGRPGRRRRGPAVVAGLALSAVALAAAVPSSGAGRGHERAQAPPRERARGPAVTVSAPVRIADAGAVRLLRPGDRVDVVAARADGRPGVRVLASGARVASVPEEGTASEQPGDPAAGGGSLVVLSVGRATAVRLAGAGAGSRLAVTLW